MTAFAPQPFRQFGVIQHVFADEIGHLHLFQRHLLAGGFDLAAQIFGGLLDLVDLLGGGQPDKACHHGIGDIGGQLRLFGIGHDRDHQTLARALQAVGPQQLVDHRPPAFDAAQGRTSGAERQEFGIVEQVERLGDLLGEAARAQAVQLGLDPRAGQVIDLHLGVDLADADLGIGQGHRGLRGIDRRFPLQIPGGPRHHHSGHRQDQPDVLAQKLDEFLAVHPLDPCGDRLGGLAWAANRVVHAASEGALGARAARACR